MLVYNNNRPVLLLLLPLLFVFIMICQRNNYNNTVEAFDVCRSCGGNHACCSSPIGSGSALTRKSRFPNSHEKTIRLPGFALAGRRKDFLDEQRNCTNKLDGVANNDYTPKSSSSSSNNDNDANNNNAFFLLLSDRWEKADPLEIRLDATLAACFVLARFLVYDVSSGQKTTPGYEIEDFVLLANTFSSSVVLAMYWTVFGIVTTIFEEGNSPFRPRKLALTTALAGPLWLATEMVFRWLPTGLVLNDAIDILTAIVTGSLGLGAVMSLGRAFTSSAQQ